MSLEITSSMLVREAMSSPVISVSEDTDIVKLAKQMKDQNVGAVIITNEDDQPVGIVTERDIVTRVVSRGGDPGEVTAKSVMSSPLHVVGPEMSLMEAMRLMDKLNIRRLGVIYKNKLVGVISDRNIIRLVPTIVEIMKEQQEINNASSVSGPSITGYCDRCESYSNNLRVVEGEFLCGDCRME
jgi:signal-transduction protein with cAMP-binding, CBS, and nucleotidyltransferase domain